MAFKMKGFSAHQGVSPMRKDDPSNGDQKNAFEASSGNYATQVEVTNPPVDTEKNEKVSGANAGDLSNVVPKVTTDDGNIVGSDVAGHKENKEKEKLQAQSKKEMYANAWQNSGAGHIVEAVKSIRRGIKKNKTKRLAKNATKLSDAKTAVGSGTETLKQAKTVERNRKKTDNKAKRDIKSKAKDKEKLTEYRKKNPVRGKEAINLLANQTKK